MEFSILPSPCFRYFLPHNPLARHLRSCGEFDFTRLSGLHRIGYTQLEHRKVSRNSPSVDDERCPRVRRTVCCNNRYFVSHLPFLYRSKQSQYLVIVALLWSTEAGTNVCTDCLLRRTASKLHSTPNVFTKS